MSYALQELQIDVEKQLKELKVSEEERSRIKEATKFGIFVVHNKWVSSGNSVSVTGTLEADGECGLDRLKPKAGEISKDVAYFSGTDIEDLWVDYPW